MSLVGPSYSTWSWSSSIWYQNCFSTWSLRRKDLYGITWRSRRKGCSYLSYKSYIYRSQADPSLYIKQTDRYLLVIIFYVQDLIIFEELHYCIGVKFKRNREARSIIMSQNNYIKEVLKRFKMEECKPVRSPFNAYSKLLKLLDEEFWNVQKEMKGVLHKAGVGSLIYPMMITRPV